MTDPTTTSPPHTKESSSTRRGTYASYSVAAATADKDAPSTAATNDEDSPASNTKDLSVLEMTRDLFQSSQEEESTSKSGIVWSFGDSDAEDNNNINNDDSNDDPEGDNGSENETELPVTKPLATRPTLSDSDTASMSADEPETPERGSKEIGDKETADAPLAYNESMEISKADASETVQPVEQSEMATHVATQGLEPKESSNKEPEEAEGDSDDDAPVAMDSDDDEEEEEEVKPNEETAKPKSSIFNIDLSDEEEEGDVANAVESASSDKEEEKSTPPKRGGTKRQPKKKPVQRTIPEDSESEQEFDDGMEASTPPPASSEKEPSTEDDAGEEADAEDNGLRRSRRTPKKHSLEVVPPTEPSPPKTSSTPKKSKDKKKKTKKEKKAGREPGQDQLLASTDYLFLQADKASVTVKDILKALEAEFDCKLSKPTRKFVRTHLVSLMSEEVQPSVSLNDDKPSQDGNVGDVEEEEEVEGQDQISEQGDVESEFEADPEDEDEDFEAPKSTKKKSSSSNKKKIQTKKKESRSKPKRPNQRKAAKAAKLVEAMRLRKKRMEELKVRNEEMQLNQTKEDQERAEKIAAKLDTNTDEMRMQRLEDRLDLLGKLDQKRIMVLLENEDIVLSDLKKENKEDEEGKGNTTETEIKEEVDSANAKKDDRDASKPAEAEAGDESSDEESSDEEELVIVGATKRIKPLAPLSAHVKASAIDVLSRIKSPDRKQQLTEQRQQTLAPAHNMRARSALRNSLKQKQRTMGNLWLARELGYKTEQEHLKDCEEAANKKRGLTILREQQRIQANERKQLRERLMYQDAPAAAADDDEENEANLEESAPPDNEEEEDEEMQLAKEIEKEEAAKITISASDEEPTSTGSVPLKDTESQGPVESNENDAEEFLAPELPSTEGTKRRQVLEDDDDSEDFSPDSSQEDQEAQPLESQVPLLPQGETPDETQRLETQLPPPAGFSMEDETQEETERLEAHVPPSAQKMPPPAAVVREVTAEPGLELSQLSDCVDKEPSKQEVPQATEAAAGSSYSKPEAVEGKDSEDSEDDGELEFVEEEKEGKSKQDRNAGWKLMLQKEAEKYKRQKRRKAGNDLVEQEAEEEEEEEVAGLEDFGFSIKKKNYGDDDDEDPDSLKVDDDDLEHVVDDVSDGEGDEEAGRIARKKQEQRDEKERHKDMIRRMREGYDGRRGGIAGSGVGARGMHRFDQLVAADNRDDAKRLGLLNEDELDSDDENNENKSGDADDEDDEGALLDKILKDRFLHRSNVELENFSDDEDEGDGKESQENNVVSSEEMAEAVEERTQERLAKRFAKRARMCRLEEMYADSQEFSQQRMIDEDESMKKELSEMKNGLVRNRSTSSRSSISSSSNLGSTLLKRQRSTISNLSTSNLGTSLKRQKSTGSTFGGSFLDTGGSLSVALRGSRCHTKRRTSFLGGDKPGDTKNQGASVVKNVALGHVVFKADSSRSSFSNSGSGSNGKGKLGSTGGNFFRRATGKNQ